MMFASIRMMLTSVCTELLPCSVPNLMKRFCERSWPTYHTGIFVRVCVHYGEQTDSMALVNQDSGEHSPQFTN